MIRILNPFAPGAGTPPPELAGRESINRRARGHSEAGASPCARSSTPPPMRPRKKLTSIPAVMGFLQR